MLYYIYGIINKINNKYYIGLTNNPRRRKNKHFTELRCECHHNIKLQRAFKKYGEDKFEFKILLEVDCTVEEISKLEQEYVIKYDSYNGGYNLNRGGYEHNGFESKFKEEDILNILAVLEFSSRGGQVLSKIYDVTKTTISRIGKGEFLEYKNKYSAMSYEERKIIYDNFCEKYNYIEEKNISNKLEGKRKLTEKQILYILSVSEFDKRKNKQMIEKLNISSAFTISSIIKGKTYKNYSDMYNILSEEEKYQIYNEALKYFNFEIKTLRKIDDKDKILSSFCLFDMIQVTPKQLTRMIPLSMGISVRLSKKQTYLEIEEEYKSMDKEQQIKLFLDTIKKYNILNCVIRNNNKETIKTILNIIYLLNEGLSQQKIADKFFILRSSVQKIHQRKIHQTVLKLHDILKENCTKEEYENMILIN